MIIYVNFIHLLQLVQAELNPGSVTGYK